MKCGRFTILQQELCNVETNAAGTDDDNSVDAIIKPYVDDAMSNGLFDEVIPGFDVTLSSSVTGNVIFP